MSQHYPSTRKTNIFFKRLLLVLAVFLMGLQGLKAQTANGYVIYYNGYFLAHNATSGAVTTTATNTFDPSTCLWTITGNYIRPVSSNGTTVLGNLYLRPRTGNNNYNLNTNTSTNYANWNGVSDGGQPYYNRYLRLNGTTWQIANTNSNRGTIYSVTKTSVAANTTVTVPTISPLSAELNLNGSQQFTASATATTTPSYETYTFNTNNTFYSLNGTTYASLAAMQASSDWLNATAAPAINYSWSLSGAANGYLTLTNGSSYQATVSYTSAANANASSTLSVTASVTANGDSDSKTSSSNATVSVVPPVNPTSISITNSSPVTIYIGAPGTVAYSLTPSGAYDNVTGASSDTDVFTVGSIDGGSATINPVGVGTATLTLTAHKLNGDAITPSVTITVNVKNKVATPAISFEQIGDGSTATTTISCATSGVTIYYKVNSGSYAEYSTSFTVDEYDEVFAYAVKTGTGSSYWDDSDEAHETYVSCSTAAPVISYIQSGTTANVTITAEAGATIYYTTDGNPPTTNSSNGTSPLTINNVANGTVVKAIAKNGSCAASDPVSVTIILSGVSGGVVTLNDREDHSWSYYSDASNPVRSLSPADVKITYYGNGIMMTGNNDYTASSTDIVQYGNTNYIGGAKVNVGGEDENTFIYYKTLERGDATQTAWTFSSSSQSSAASRCPYTSIPNPFQVRPTYGSEWDGTNTDTWTGWRGFQCWRLKRVTGGAVYAVASGGNPLSTGAVINAETEIYFAPNSEYGMEVELEAVWARAYVVKANGNEANAIQAQTVGYERNFIVLHSTSSNFNFGGTSGKRITNINYSATVSTYYPDGTQGANAGSTIRGAGGTNLTLESNTKFENIEFSMGSYNLTAANHDVIIGRGVSGSVGTLRGISGDAGDLDYTLRVESGTFGQFDFVSEVNCTVSGRVQVKSILGCDYDRAKGTNTNLSVANQNNMFFTRDVSFSNPSNKDQKVFDLVIKSGEFQKGWWDSDENSSGTTGTNGFNYVHSMYCGANFGNGNPTHYPGIRYVTIEGGALGNINGGRGTSAAGNNDNPDATTDQTDAWKVSFSLRIKKDAIINGCVFGGAANTSSWGSKRIVLTGGKVYSWIAGGANGTNQTSGDSRTRGTSYIYVGGTAEVGGPNAKMKNSTLGGQVFGAGRGFTNQAASMDTTMVVIADNAKIMKKNNDASGNVYGGGNIGYAHKQSNIFILGGTIEGGVYGGAFNNALNIPEVNITMKGGLVEGGVYGGSNSNGTISGDVTMQIDGGQVGTTSTTANIHGGGLGQPTRVSGNVDLTLGTAGQTTDGVTVYGDVYGGSALGHVNGTATTNTYHTNVTLNKGTINGSLYGGALGDASTAANVYGPVAVKVYGGSVNTTSADGSGAVYGCNNIDGAPQNTVTVDIYGTDPAPDANHYALDAVYGGGNKASYAAGTPVVTVHNCNNSIGYVYGGGNAAHITNGNTDVTIYGGNKIGNVFGGGNGTVTAANVSGNTNVKIYGGTILHVFGGSNSQGNIGNTINVTVNKQADTDPNGSSTACEMKIGELYGGGNLAASNAGSITIGCTGSLTADHSTHPENIGTSLEGIGTVYGGANQANITGNITLTMNSGMVGNLFGGNNTSGTISGGIQVKVEKNNSADCASDWYVGNVFGGGNLAQYTIPNNKALAVNILNGTVSGNVYGGGKGDPNDHTMGQVTGNPVVTIGDNTTAHAAYVASVGGDVYGGGDAGDVLGTPVVNVVNKCTTTISGDVYGGGNAADVNGTDVNIDGGIITGMVFGGGHGNNDPADLKVANVNGNVDVDITGGTINKVFAGSNLNGSISGTVTLDINKSTATGACDMKIGEVYGGGNEAAGNAGTITVGCTGTWTTTGTNNHTNHNNTDNRIGYELEGIGAVYGGANQANIGTSLAPSNITLNINSGMVDTVFGGNNTSGDIYGNIQVNINKNAASCDWYVGDVFGGGNLADYDGTPDVNIQAGTVSRGVFGGGNAASVGGSDVAVSGGQINGGVYGGCNASGNTGPVVISLTGGQVGTSGVRADVFGGGFGKDTETSSDIKVTLNGTTVYGDLYGGSAFGSVNSSATNDTTLMNLESATLHGSIFGGGKGQVGPNSTDSITAFSNGKAIVNIDVYNQYLTGIYGGANINGNVKGNITVNVLADVGASGNTLDIFGGGLGAATNTEGNVTVTIGTDDGSKQPVIYGDIYGGSALGHVNNEATDLTKIDFLNGTLHGTIFGGGLGDASNAAKVNGEVQVNISNDSQTAANCHIDLRGASIYGCNNTNGSPQDNVTVNIYKTGFTTGDYESQSGALYAIDQVFGGGKNADYLPENGVANSTKVAKVHVHSCANTIRRIFSGGDAAAATGVAATIEGGRYDYIFGGGNGEVIAANIGDGGTNLIVHAGIIGHLFGGSNERGAISGAMRTTIDGDNMNNACREAITEFFGGGNLAPINTDIITTLDCGVGTFDAVYGGSNAADITGNVTLNIKGGTITNVFGGSKGREGNTPADSANIAGNVTLNLMGGIVQQAFGGSNINGNITGKITVNVLDTVAHCGLQLDTVYGSGNLTAYKPDDNTILSPEVNILKGTVNDVVFGGGKGETAIVTANPKVTIGDLANTDYVAIVNGKVFGGGNAAAVQGGTSVLIQQSHSVVDTIFGGGNLADVSGATTVNVNGGTVNYDVYGGGALADIGGSAVTLNGGTVRDLYGGGLGRLTPTAIAALVNGPVQVTVNGGKVTGSVYGCNNLNGAPQSTVKVDIYGTDPAPSASAYALGSVFGGGNQAAYTYGNGYPQVTVHNCDNSIEYVYGGGNAAAVVSTDVKIYGGNKIGYVFGGGNGAGVADDFVMLSGSAVTNIYGGTILHVFAGNNTNGVITGTSEVHVNKMTETGHSSCPMYIGEVYGGGNFAAGKAGSVDIGCTGDLVALGAGEHYGINKEGIQYVYGGANQADISNDISVAIHSGIVENVFGGNNQSGTISGTITVNIDSTGTCGWYVGNVYGGGNQATYGTANSDYPQVNILKGLVSGDVFGGGLGSAGTAGQVTGNPQVVVNGAKARVNGGVYGGGSLAPTEGNPLVTLTNGALTNVYGGGKAASITGAPTVNINGGTVSTGVYGGCNTSGTVSGDITVNVKSGVIGTQANLNNNILANVFGGGYGPATTTSGNIEVNIDSLATFVAPVIYGDVYGGSALGDVNDAATDNTVVNVLYGTLKTHEVTSGGFPVYHGGNVFGGGLGDGSNAAKVNGTVTVNIGRPYSRSFGDLNPEDDNNVGNAVIEGNVYGCNNTNGSPQDSVTVHIYRTHRGATDQITYDNDDATYALHNVFGGGNEADYIPATGASNKKLKVWIHDCYNSIERVFGGSNAAAAGAAGNEVTVHTNIEGGRFNNVFGGGNGEVSAADIHGDVKLEIHGGLVDEFYVGSNQRGTIYGSSTVTVDEISNCQEVLITEFFCGGKYANVVGNIEATIDCADALTVTNLYGGCKEADVVAGNGQPGNVHLSVYGGHYTNVFGGSKGVIPPDGANAEQLAAASADIDGNVVLDLYGGTIENVYGGSNINGNIKGTITVNVIDKEDPDCPLYITNIYGGSNETDYTPTYTITPGTERITPVVNVVHINSGIQGNIYGGSRGLSEAEEPTKVVACPQVNIGYDASMTGLPPTATYDPADYSQKAVVSGNVFGGGDAATVDGNTAIFLRNRAKVFGNVYGGGNKAEVTGNTNVIVNGQNN